MTADLVLRRAIEAVQYVADPSPPWADILSSAKDLIGGDSASFIVFEGDRLATLETIQIDQKTQDAYSTHFASQDIMLSPGVPRPPGTWLDTQDVLCARERDRNPYYVDFMCKHRMRQIVSFVLEESPMYAASISFQREFPAPGARTQISSQPVRQYTDALREALARRRAAASQWLDTAEETASAFGDATFLVTGTGVVLRMAPHSAETMERESALRVRHGALWHPQEKAREALARALLRANGGNGIVRLALPGERGRVRKLELVRAPAGLRLGHESMVLVRMRRQLPAGEHPVETLCLAFNLTPAEGRVLAALADGQTPIEHANAQRVSIHTVRKQIATLMDKMYCARQIDLVRMALGVT